MSRISEIILSFIGIVLTSVIIPYIREKTTAEQKKRIKFLIGVAVAAAEQTIHGESKGEEKLNYVLEYLYNLGVKVSNIELKTFIESEVYSMNSTRNSKIAQL